MTVTEILSDPSRWCKGAIAKNSKGEKVASVDQDACSWCLAGALRKAYQDDAYDTYFQVWKKVHDEVRSPISMWNDAEERTYQDVIDLVTKLGI